jgi:hypothetical protein
VTLETLVRPVLLIAFAITLSCRMHLPAGRALAGAKAQSRVRITFAAQGDSFVSAAREYEQLWARQGPKIVHAMEEVSGLAFVNATFADTAITAIILEAPSNSGFRESPMRLRASYPLDTKRATLIHELGHRLQSGLFRREEEEHGPLFLWLYDVWVRLYGRDFADRQVAVEKRRGGPYPAAWDAALALSPAQRATRWQQLVAERMPTRR